MKKKLMSFLAFMIITVMSCSVVFADETTLSDEKSTYIDETTASDEKATSAETETTVNKDEVPTTAVDEKQQLSIYVTKLVQSVFVYNEKELDYIIYNSYGIERDLYKTYKDLIVANGDVTEYEDAKVVEIEDGYKVTIKVKCKNGEGKAVFTFETISNQLQITSAVFDTVAEKEEASMGRAALNTLIGLGTVFFSLVLILYIISLLKYADGFVAGVGKIFGKITGIFKKKEVEKEVVNEAINQVVARIEENETNDLELVAVITAAIAAQTGASTDSFVVRKIKRR